MGGGFLEQLFGGPQQAAPSYAPAPMQPQYEPAPGYETQVAHPAVSPRFMKQEVNYDGHEKPGTIIINTQERLLYLVQENGRALRYGVGVGKPGFSWAGTHHVTQKREWPDWTPPAKCSSAVPICRVTWQAASTIRSARARCISARRSTASTARTSPGPSERRYRRAASACATRTSMTSTTKVKVGTKVVVI